MGVLGDIDFSKPGPAGTTVTCTDVVSSLEYFYAAEKPPEELPTITVLYSSDTKRPGVSSGRERVVLAGRLHPSGASSCQSRDWPNCMLSCRPGTMRSPRS
ncbi:unnamed protein product [Symbiodinium sp. CCMP2592]|nr:unnamed protein product [Symbiodinium sp. CCMP2592]